MSPDQENDPRVQKIIKAGSHPELEQIVEIAKDQGITKPYDLWEFYDAIRKAWLERKGGD